MWGEPKQATSATTSIFYITIGALMDVWTTVYYFYCRGRIVSDETYFWIYGAFATGLVLMLIGAAVGRIGRSAMSAEVSSPPPKLVAPTAVAPTAVAPTAVAPAVTETVGGKHVAYVVPAENASAVSNGVV